MQFCNSNTTSKKKKKVNHVYLQQSFVSVKVKE